MSNLGNYSPYNKTYKFLMFQNQAYHQRNKRNVKPCVRTNLRYAKSQNHSHYNPELSDRVEDLRQSDGTRCLSPSGTVKSMLFTSKSLRESNPQIHKEKKVIHKHESFEKFRNWKIQKDNTKLVNRLVSTSCHVIKNQKTQRSFNNHLRFRQIRNKYSPEGTRKHALVVGNEDLLCPTLKHYNQSGLASKFIQQHLSWSKSTTPKTSSIRKRRSNFSCI